MRCIFCAQGKVFSGLSSLITGDKRQRKECAESKKTQKVKNKMRIFENWNFCGAGQISRAARRRMHSSLTNQRAICSLNYDRFPPKNSSRKSFLGPGLAKLDDIKLMLPLPR